MRIAGGTVLSMRPGDEPRVADVFVDGDRIATAAAGETIDASGCFVLPGLVQTHVHLVQTIFRGLAEDRSLLHWLRERIWPLEAAHDEGSLRASARLGILELLSTGTTAILDMATTHGTDVVAEELVASGIRASFGKAMMDTGDAVPSRLRERTTASLDEADALRERWSGAGDGRIRYAYAPRFALSCSRELLEGVAERVAAHGSSLVHTHSNEARDEGAAVRAASGLAPAAYLAAVGLATDRAVFAHGVHLEPAERALLAERHVAIAHCPSSNLKLGSGIADVAALREAGITVGIGADGAACNNRLDAFAEVRLAVLLARGLHGAGAMSALDGLALATRDGARALHRDDEIGTIEAGKQADLVILDAERLAPGGDPATRIVFGGGSRAVRDVIVAGRVVVRDGVPLTLDRQAVLAAAREALPALVERAGL